MLKDETEDHPEFADFDEPTSMADGQSTAPLSSVGTPLASAPAPGKLKLTFNNANQNHVNGGTSGRQSDDDDNDDDD